MADLDPIVCAPDPGLAERERQAGIALQAVLDAKAAAKAQRALARDGTKSVGQRLQALIQAQDLANPDAP